MDAADPTVRRLGAAPVHFSTKQAMKTALPSRHSPVNSPSTSPLGRRAFLTCCRPHVASVPANRSWRSHIRCPPSPHLRRASSIFNATPNPGPWISTKAGHQIQAQRRKRGCPSRFRGSEEVSRSLSRSIAFRPEAGQGMVDRVLQRTAVP